MSGFTCESFLPREVLDRITELRVNEPDRPVAAAGRRKRRATLTRDGRLSIIAADHPGRRVTAVGGEPLAMGDRRDYLARVARILVGGAADGVMATMDLLEDLLLLSEIVREGGGPAFLDDKLLIASLNRGGLAGTAWELDDPMTGIEAEALPELGLDGGKMLLRIGDDDPGSLRTLVACSQAISRLTRLGLPSFVEPLPVTRSGAGLKVDKQAEPLARAACVAAALGNSSRLLWLKLPYCEDYEKVARATTCPILLLGGESVGDARPLLGQIAAGLRAGASVRGALVGRNVLYPGDQDPLAVARAVDGIIHKGWDAEVASRALEDQAGADLDAITRWLS